LHAIYDQFLPILVPPPPTDGVTQWANDYYKRKVLFPFPPPPPSLPPPVYSLISPYRSLSHTQQANEEHQQLVLESAALTPADIGFSAKLAENAPKILHLGTYSSLIC
jgi:hypothetical protein